MKIRLPHRTLVITEKEKMLSDKEKIEFVNKLLKENVELHGETISLDLYFSENKSRASIVAQDMIAYFITKEHMAHQDIMTRKTIKKMQKGDGRTVNFTNLSYQDKINLGLDDATDIYEQ